MVSGPGASSHNRVSLVTQTLGPEGSGEEKQIQIQILKGILKGIVQHFGKFAHLLSCPKSDKKINSHSHSHAARHELSYD